MDRFKVLTQQVLNPATEMQTALIPEKFLDYIEHGVSEPTKFHPDWTSQKFWYRWLALLSNTNLTQRQTIYLLVMADLGWGNIHFTRKKDSELEGEILHLDRSEKIAKLYAEYQMKGNYEDLELAEYQVQNKRQLALLNLLRYGWLPAFLWDKIMPDWSIHRYTRPFDKLNMDKWDGDGNIIHNWTDYSIITLISANPNLGESLIDTILKLPDDTLTELQVSDNVLGKIAANSRLTDQQFDFLQKKSVSDIPQMREILKSLARNPKLTAQQAETILLSNQIAPVWLNKLSFTNEQFKTIMETAETYGMKERTILYPALENYDKTRIWRRLSNNQNLTKPQSEKLVKTIVNYTKEVGENDSHHDTFFHDIIRSQYLSPDLFNYGLNFPDILSSNPHLTDSQTRKLLQTEGVSDLLIAEHGSFGDEIFIELLSIGSGADGKGDLNTGDSLAENPTINPLHSSKFSKGLFNWRW
tara:strand:+ start:1722 stop:3134 length:1413 start_codon:yes stop_codon:yes gene_type:complete